MELSSWSFHCQAKPIQSPALLAGFVSLNLTYSNHSSCTPNHKENFISQLQIRSKKTGVFVVVLCTLVWGETKCRVAKRIELLNTRHSNLEPCNNLEINWPKHYLYSIFCIYTKLIINPNRPFSISKLPKNWPKYSK